ncbi:hypothetical protein Trydic_g838 [Trypoxylus dichotomus]
MADHFRESIAEPIVARECTGRPPIANVVSEPGVMSSVWGNRASRVYYLQKIGFGRSPSVHRQRCLEKIPQRRSRTNGITSPIRLLMSTSEGDHLGFSRIDLEGTPEGAEEPLGLGQMYLHKSVHDLEA